MDDNARLGVITSHEVRSELYFSAHVNEGLVLYTPHGSYSLTCAAGEDLLTNLEINVEAARQLARIESGRGEGK